MSQSIQVQPSSVVILVIFYNEGHRSWLQSNSGLFRLYLNCAKLFSHCQKGSSSDLFLFPWQSTPTSDLLTLAGMTFGLSLLHKHLPVVCLSGRNNVDGGGLARAGGEREHWGGAELPQRTAAAAARPQPGSQTGTSICSSRSHTAIFPPSDSSSLLLFLSPPPKSKQCCYFLFLQANGKMEEVQRVINENKSQRCQRCLYFLLYVCLTRLSCSVSVFPTAEMIHDQIKGVLERALSVTHTRTDSVFYLKDILSLLNCPNIASS